MAMSLKGLAKTIDKELILIGENHGVKENAKVIRELAEVLKPELDMVGFEYPVVLQDILRKFPRSRRELESKDNFLQILEDGRCSEPHLNLIAWLNKIHIPIFCFDQGGYGQERDKLMAEKVNQWLKKLRKDKKALVISGNIHTRREIFKLGTKTGGEIEVGDYFPMGAQLNKESYLIDIQYCAGQFYNFGRKYFDTKKCPEEDWQIIDMDHANVYIRKATPTK